MTASQFTFIAIGNLKTCFEEKWGAPRQSLLVREATGILKLRPDFEAQSMLRQLETFSHLWIVYVFHKNLQQGWSPTVEPPRAEIKDRLGVFATRSPHRPNPIGLSLVKLDRIDLEARGGAEIHLSGLDILDNTPVLDIKPYLPYADVAADSNSGWASDPILRYPVVFSECSLERINGPLAGRHLRLEKLLTEILELDPRPTPQKKEMPIDDPQSEGRSFAFRLFDFDVKWKIQNRGIFVSDLILVQK